MVNVLKLRALLSFSFQKKCWLSGLELTKCLSEQQKGKTAGKTSMQLTVGGREPKKAVHLQHVKCIVNTWVCAG